MSSLALHLETSPRPAHAPASKHAEPSPAASPSPDFTAVLSAITKSTATPAAKTPSIPRQKSSDAQPRAKHPSKGADPPADASSSDAPAPDATLTDQSSSEEPCFQSEASDESPDDGSPQPANPQNTPSATQVQPAPIPPVVPTLVQPSAPAAVKSAPGLDATANDTESRHPVHLAELKAQSEAAAHNSKPNSQPPPNASTEAVPSQKQAAADPPAKSQEKEQNLPQIDSPDPIKPPLRPRSAPLPIARTEDNQKPRAKAEQPAAPQPIAQPASQSADASSAIQPSPPQFDAGSWIPDPTQPARDLAPAAQIATAPTPPVQNISADSAPPAQDSPTPDAQNTFDQIVLGLRGKFDAKSGKADIRLEPPNLGTVRVSLTLDNGALTAEFQSSSDLVRGLLKDNLDKLKTVLQGQGVTVDKLAVDSPDAIQAPTAQQGQQQASLGNGGANHDGRSAGEYHQHGDGRQRRNNDQESFARILRKSSDQVDLVA